MTQDRADDAWRADPQARVNSPTAALLKLASLCGVSAEYATWNGEPRRSSARAIGAVLTAMGVDSGDDATCHRELDRLTAERDARVAPPVVVVRAGTSIGVPVRATAGTVLDARLILENGEVLASTTPVAEAPSDGPGDTDDGPALRTTLFPLPADLPLGYHVLEVALGESGSKATTAIVVTPDRLELPHALRAHRPWGLMAQLYAVRSGASWGVGDLADLRDLAVLGATKAGADFVLINPLHAAEPISPLTASPYLPSSRRFVHPIYIRVEDIPEAAYAPGAERSLVDWLGETTRAASLSPTYIDRDSAWTAKKTALETLFTAPRSAARAASFAAFTDEQGDGLRDFATWCAMAEARDDASAPLPLGLDSPQAPAVAELRARLPERIEFYCWLQWIADEQRAAAQDAAVRAGMRIGVMTDLAVGVHPSGADAWALGDVLAAGVGVGAPPDLYNQQGQDWSQPPWLPQALEDAGYAPFRDVVRAALRHAGALRIDHIIGLFRLWWVPNGLGAADGVYVRYDHEALIGILALEAARAGALVIGEDLGTVEPGVADYLESRGILGTSILWFEKDVHGKLRAPGEYRPGVLATITTHDIPPTEAYLAGEHVVLRERLGLLVEPVEKVRADAWREREDAIAMLTKMGWLKPADPGTEPDLEAIVVALHRALFATPSALIGVAVTDLIGDRRTQNQPGTDKEYPNWRVPLTDSRGAVVLLDQLFDHPRSQRLIAGIRACVAP